MSIDRLYHDLDQARGFSELIMGGKHPNQTWEISKERLGKVENARVSTPDQVVEILESIQPTNYSRIWIRPNPLTLPPVSLAPARKAIEKLPNSSATAEDVARSLWVQVDFDAEKPKGKGRYASTDSEHTDALESRDRYHSHALTMYGIEPAYVGDTGNGGVLLYRVDLPNTPQNAKLIKDAFRAIAESAGVKIDTATLDVVRFMGLPGTINRGKEAADDRPHRLRTGDVYPDAPVISAATLEVLQAEYRPLQSPGSTTQEQSIDNALTDSERAELISIVSEGWTDGNRHNYGLAVSGLLSHMGVSLDQAKSIIEEISTKAGDTDTDDRLEACERTYDRRAAGETVAWFEALEETLPQSNMQAIGKLRAGIRDRTGDDDPDWQEPIPLTVNEGPPIDPGLLPDGLRTYSEALAASMQVPLDMVVTGALGTISAAITGRYIVKHRWKEPVHIMAVNAALPGARKSPLMSALTGALYSWQKEQQQRDRLLLAEWDSVQRTLKKQQDSFEREPHKNESSGGDRDLLRRAAVQELHEHELKKPVITTLVVDDVTPEKVAWMLTEQPGISVVSAESAYLENFYRYGDTPNFNVFLQGHAADPVSIHRRNGDDATVERACLALNIAIQPDSLKSMGGVQSFMARGGTARLLMTIPKDIVGERLTGADVPQMPESLSQWWDGVITRLLEKRAAIATTLALLMTPEATDEADRFETVCDRRAKAAGDDNPMRAWILKQTGGALRLAGLLHLMDYEHTEPISQLTMQRGIALSEWYREHAEVAFSMMADTTDDHARTVWNALIEHGELSVNRSQLQQRLRGRRAFKRAADLDGPLTILEEYGYIRIRKESPEGRGRPVEWIDLNPLAMHQAKPSAQVVRFTNNETEDLQPTGTEGFRLAGEAI